MYTLTLPVGSATHVNEDLQSKPAHERLEREKMAAPSADVTTAANNEKNKGEFSDYLASWMVLGKA